MISAESELNYDKLISTLLKMFESIFIQGSIKNLFSLPLLMTLSLWFHLKSINCNFSFNELVLDFSRNVPRFVPDSNSIPRARLKDAFFGCC